MIYKEKFVSDEIISKLPNWLIHFCGICWKKICRQTPRSMVAFSCSVQARDNLSFVR